MIVVLLCPCVFSQTVNRSTNIPRNGDIMIRQMLEVFSPGNNGKDVIWDFSSLSQESDSDENIYVEYFIDPEASRLSVADGNVVFRYSDLEDTLQVVGRETTLERICYDVPQTVMTYPFTYGSVISGPYKGHGTYCSRLNIRVAGTILVESDAEGIIITGECDTLYDVMRVRTLRTGSISMHSVADADFSDTSHIKQEIEERFEWYVSGYRYPLYETTTVAYYDNMTMLYDTHSASRISPDCMHLSADPENDSILAHTSRFSCDGQQSSFSDSITPENLDIIRYNVLTDSNTLTLEYDLDKDATLTYIICNKMGMLYVNLREIVKAGLGYKAEFDLSGFIPNDYILYISVNGTVYSEVFKVK